MLPRPLAALSVLLALAALPTLAQPDPAGPAAVPKPVACSGGRFLVAAGSPALVTGAADGLDAVTLDGTHVSIDSGCGPVTGKVVATRKTTTVTAKWATCGALKKPSLTLTFDAACNVVSGTFRALKIKPRRFTARRSACGDGRVDAVRGEACEAALDCRTGATCDACACSASPFDPGNEFGPPTDPLPPGASDVSTGEFLARVASGGITLLKPGEQAARIAADAARSAADHVLVDAAIAAHPEFAHLVQVNPGPADRALLSGAEVAYRDVAAALRNFPARGNQEALYASMYGLLPEEMLSGYPLPADLGTVTDADLARFVVELEALAADWLPNEAAPELPAASTPATHAEDDPPPECSSSDQCYEGIWKRMTWPLKWKATAIREQGNRGTCAAHGIVAGIEAYLNRANSRLTNLSEQELYATAKGSWHPSSNAYGDGLPTADVMDEMIENNFRLHTETAWGYNPSWDRVEHEDDEYYTKSCDGYAETCSDTNHQMGVYCTTVNGMRYCGYDTPVNRLGAPSENYRLTQVASLWNGFEPENSMTRVRAHLKAGHPVVFALNVDQQFKTIDKDSPWLFGTGGSDVGGHAVLATGYFTNAELDPHYGDVPFNWLNGGGYLVIKNSWGCDYGDAGYVYAGKDWVIEHAKDAVAVLGVASSYPTVSLSVNKANFTSPGLATFTASVNSLVTKVRFYRGFNLVGEDNAPPFKMGYQVTSTDNGDPAFFARAFDAADNAVYSNIVPLHVDIDVTPPTVSLSALDTTVMAPGSTVLIADATDNKGVVKVDFFEGFSKIGSDSAPPFIWPVNYGGGDVGEHVYTALAWDAAGNTAYALGLHITVIAALPPIVSTFTAAPDHLPLGGGETTLAWSVFGASSLSIDHGVGDVTGLTSKAVTVTESTLFTLTAINAHGTTTRQVFVHVSVGLPPVIDSFTSDPPSLPPGGGALTLSWHVRFAETVSIDQGIGDVTLLTDKTVTVGAATTFTLTATNDSGTSTRVLVVPIDLWVSPTGNDLNAGSPSAPLKTIAKAATLAATPSTIHLLDGTWDASVDARLGGSDAAPCGSYSGITIPAGVNVVAVNPGAALVKPSGPHGLCLAGNRVENVRFEHGSSFRGRMIEASSGESTIVGATFARGNPAITVKGTAKLTVTSMPADATSYSLPDSNTFAAVYDTATLLVWGGAVTGTLTDGVSGNAVFSASGGTLELRGVTVSDTTQSAAILAAGGTVRLTMGSSLVGPSNPARTMIGINARGDSHVEIYDSSIIGWWGGIYLRNYDTVTLNVTASDSTFSGNSMAIRYGFANTAYTTLTRTTITGNLDDGIYYYAGGALTLTDCTVTDNGTGTSGDGVDLPSSTGTSLYARGTTFSGNKGASVRATGNQLSVIDLGTVSSPGGNVFSGTGNEAHVVLTGFFLTQAVGNTWLPSVQAADAHGHYEVNGVGAKYEVTTGRGANYTLASSASLRLAENP